MARVRRRDSVRSSGWRRATVVRSTLSARGSDPSEKEAEGFVTVVMAEELDEPIARCASSAAAGGSG